MAEAETKRMKPQRAARKQAQDVEIEERQQAVFRFWRDNPLIGYRAIGKKFRISHETARKDLNAVLLRNAADFKGEVDEWKEKQINRLEFLLETFEKGIGTRSRDRIETGRLILRIIRELNDITGVRAAQKVELSGTIGFNWSELTADAVKDKNLTDE